MSETLQQILAIVVPIVVAAIGAVTPILISWLKKQKWVQKAHLEDFLSALIPQVVEWVEYWANELVKKGGEKPTPEAKLAKAKEILAEKAPMLKNETEIMGRIEAALKAGVNKDK